MYFKFTENDKFVNTIVTYPDYEIVLSSGSLWINNRIDQGLNVSSASLSVHEINVNRSSGLVYPFIPKGGEYERLGTTDASYFHSASYGTSITGTYPVTSSIKITNYTDMTNVNILGISTIVRSLFAVTVSKSINVVKDARLNGDLVVSKVNQADPSNFISGSTVVGTVLYDEGIILLYDDTVIPAWGS